MYSNDTTIKIMQKEFSMLQRSLVAQFIHDECVKKNSNFIAGVFGKPGSGKSVSSLRIAELIDKTFSINQVVWSVEELLRLVIKYQDDQERGISVKGKVILLDEGGIIADARDWQNKLHKILNDSVETFRFLNLVLLITVPSKDRLDKKIRGLMHGMFEIKDKHPDYRIAKFNLIKHDPVTDYDYYPFLKVQCKGWITKIRSIKIVKPNRELLVAYEQKMLEFKRRINVAGLEKISIKKAEKQKSVDEWDRKQLSERQKQVWDLTLLGWSVDKIAMELGLSSLYILSCLKASKKKGWDWQKELNFKTEQEEKALLPKNSVVEESIMT